VVQMVEEAFDIGFDEITETAVLEIEGEVFYGLLRTPPRSVSVAALDEVLLVDGVQQLGRRPLDEFVFERRDAERPLFAFALWDHDAPHQPGAVAFVFQALHQVLQPVLQTVGVVMVGDFVHALGGLRIQFPEAAPQEVQVDFPVEIPETVVFAGACPHGYSPQ